MKKASGITKNGMNMMLLIGKNGKEGGKEVNRGRVGRFLRSRISSIDREIGGIAPEPSFQTRRWSMSREKKRMTMTKKKKIKRWTNQTKKEKLRRTKPALNRGECCSTGENFKPSRTWGGKTKLKGSTNSITGGETKTSKGTGAEDFKGGEEG